MGFNLNKKDLEKAKKRQAERLIAERFYSILPIYCEAMEARCVELYFDCLYPDSRTYIHLN